METKFTKGEWWVNPTGPHWNNPEIASYEICYSKDAECVVDHVYELADAHLIAAAPEMYGMLEIISKYYVDELNRPVMKSDIEKLLAKARGEQ